MSSRETRPEGRPFGADPEGTHPGLAPEPVTLGTPPPQEILQAVIDLSRSVEVDAHVDEVVHAYVDRFKEIFPGRLFCVRLFSEDSGDVRMVYATGKLRPERRNSLEVTYEALERHGIRASTLRRLRVTDHYLPVMRDGASGFDIPMTDGDEIAGILSVEYPRAARPPSDDRPLIVQLALQLASTLHNARMHRESVYLRDYLSKLLDTANAPILVIDKAGAVSFANRAFLGLTRFRRDEVLGKDWVTMVPEPDRRHLLPVTIGALRGEAASNVEIKLPRRDGTYAHVSVNAASILGPDGDVEGVILICRDNTEIRELEKQIIHAEKLATLGQLAAGVVHELNNPLTSISVYGNHLLKKSQERTSDPKDVEKLRRIVESADRVLNFTRDLVTYARPSAERPVALDIHDVIDQGVVFCEHVIDEAGAKVEKRYDRELPPVYGVHGQLVQVLVNLITNACHAMPMGAGKLTIETAAESEGRLALRVTDSGKGIPQDNLTRVFEPFFSTKGEGKGTGLGLSIVKNIIEQHRGEISVRSEVGTGTTFEILLVCRPDPHSQPPSSPPPMPSPGSRPPGALSPVR